MKLKLEQIKTDLLIIGGGTAGCYAALTFCARSSGTVLIAEKAICGCCVQRQDYKFV
jgi:adenylylsulfate reductase subunit A